MVAVCAGRQNETYRYADIKINSDLAQLSSRRVKGTLHTEALKISVLNYTGHRANWGSRATSENLLEDLRSVFGSDAEFHLVPLLSSGWKDRAIKLIWGKRIHAALRGIRLPGDWLKSAARVIYSAHLDQVQKADLVVFQSEGTMNGQKFSTGDRLLLLPYLAATVLDKPVLAINGSVEPIVPEFESAIRHVFQQFRYIAAREPVSKEYLNKIGVNATCLPDSAFDVRPSISEQAPSSPYICLSGSAILRNVNYDAFFDAVIEWASSNGIAVVTLLSGPADQKCFGEKPGVTRIRTEATPSEVAAVIEGAKLLISGRYHMNIFAAAVHTPFISLPSGSHKTDGLLEILGNAVPSSTFDDLGAIRSTLDQVLRDRDAISAKLAARMQAIRSLRAEGLQNLKASFSRSEPAE